MKFFGSVASFGVASFSLAAAAALPAGAAVAADLPVIKAGTDNSVPACATPGRLMAFLRSRNAHLDGQFDHIATQYMRHGEALGLRWDIAYFQMLLETGNLTFTGAVKPKQNNFAGLGATGGAEPGESFPDVSTGVRAHLEHVAMYAGMPVAAPVAERTRKVQEWGVLTSWQKSIKGPMTFAQLAHHWAPKSKHYVSDIENVSDSFYDGACKAADPNPELVAEARSSGPAAGVKTASTEAPAAAADPVPQESAGTKLARRALEDARASGAQNTRSALGVGAPAAEAAPAATLNPAPAAEAAAKTQAPAYTLLNGAAETPAAPVAKAEATAKPASSAKAPIVMASAADAAARGGATANAGTKCRVWTASYGGAKAMIIKAVTTEGINYTVLDVHEGSERREAEAYIAAYAKGGQLMEDFASEPAALEKAFQLCPEG